MLPTVFGIYVENAPASLSNWATLMEVVDDYKLLSSDCPRHVQCASEPSVDHKRTTEPVPPELPSLTMFQLFLSLVLNSTYRGIEHEVRQVLYMIRAMEAPGAILPAAAGGSTRERPDERTAFDARRARRRESCQESTTAKRGNILQWRQKLCKTLSLLLMAENTLLSVSTEQGIKAQLARSELMDWMSATIFGRAKELPPAVRSAMKADILGILTLFDHLFLHWTRDIMWKNKIIGYSRVLALNRNLTVLIELLVESIPGLQHGDWLPRSFPAHSTACFPYARTRCSMPFTEAVAFIRQISTKRNKSRVEECLTTLNSAGMKGRGKTEDPRENPPTSGVVQHESHMRISEFDLAGNRARNTLRKAVAGAPFILPVNGANNAPDIGQRITGSGVFCHRGSGPRNAWRCGCPAVVNRLLESVSGNMNKPASTLLPAFHVDISTFMPYMFLIVSPPQRSRLNAVACLSCRHMHLHAVHVSHCEPASTLLPAFHVDICTFMPYMFLIVSRLNAVACLSCRHKHLHAVHVSHREPASTLLPAFHVDICTFMPYMFLIVSPPQPRLNAVACLSCRHMHLHAVHVSHREPASTLLPAFHVDICTFMPYMFLIVSPPQRSRLNAVACLSCRHMHLHAVHVSHREPASTLLPAFHVDICTFMPYMFLIVSPPQRSRLNAVACLSCRHMHLHAVHVSHCEPASTLLPAFHVDICTFMPYMFLIVSPPQRCCLPFMSTYAPSCRTCFSSSARLNAVACLSCRHKHLHAVHVSHREPASTLLPAFHVDICTFMPYMFLIVSPPQRSRLNAVACLSCRHMHLHAVHVSHREPASTLLPAFHVDICTFMPYMFLIVSPPQRCLLCTVQRHDGNTAHLARRSDETLGVRVSVALRTPPPPPSPGGDRTSAVITSLFLCGGRPLTLTTQSACERYGGRAARPCVAVCWEMRLFDETIPRAPNVLIYEKKTNFSTSRIVAIRHLMRVPVSPLAFARFCAMSSRQVGGPLKARRGRRTHNHRRGSRDGNTARHARRSNEALGVRVSVARTAPSLPDLERAVRYKSFYDVSHSYWPALKTWHKIPRDDQLNAKSVTPITSCRSLQCQTQAYASLCYACYVRHVDRNCMVGPAPECSVSGTEGNIADGAMSSGKVNCTQVRNSTSFLMEKCGIGKITAARCAVFQ
ncbi:hypothetical protein PR048_010773 [Dryococelus australis]|uniref:Uncharacterized protein n=1 Tax=Dryococelus australis TaxID=614101 RepID=A0ABQ9I3M0_9NEOP|nr:hypothetical protein PR048_010773 [Dryococelus australis]